MEKTSNETVTKLRKLIGVAEPIADLNEISRIASKVHIKGDVRSDFDVRIDGVVEGSIFSDGKIVIGDAATVKGKVYCNNLSVWGTLEGEVYVNNVLSLKSSAKVRGSIHVNKFQVEMGVSFDGSCTMINETQYGEFRTKALKERGLDD